MIGKIKHVLESGSITHFIYMHELSFFGVFKINF